MNVIIVPAYEPDESLVQLIGQLKACNYSSIIVVDDGSGDAFQSIFQSINDQHCYVVHHHQNMGKGAAIKTGIQVSNERFKNISYYITCDADGQHLLKDIQHIDEETHIDQKPLILGVRTRKRKNTPFRSRFGNWFSALYFRLSTGVYIADTQTGLRAIPFDLTAEALAVKENRYDYEMQFLMRVARSSYPIKSIPIETVYFEANKKSHFKTVLDSIRIYKQPIRFTIASITSAIIDLGLFTLLFYFFEGHLLRAVTIASIIARLISGSYNFMMNRLWSFNNRANIRHQFFRYGALYVTQLLLSIAFVYLLSQMFKYITFGKMIVDGTLFVISYFIQKHWVFNKKTRTS